MDHAEAQQSLGTYVLGALDAAERTAVEEHLKTCAPCRAELVTFAGLPALMGRLTVDEVPDGRLPQPAPSLLSATIAAVENEKARNIRQVRHWRSATFAAIGTALAACVALIIVLTAGRSTAPSTAGRQTVASGQSAASGAISLQSKPWGTQIHLVLADMPRQGTFIAWAIGNGGERTTAATWRATSTAEPMSPEPHRSTRAPSKPSRSPQQTDQPS